MRGKSLAITQRDLTVFAALAGYRYLSSTYLHAFAEANYRPAIYELGPKAKCLLGEVTGDRLMERSYLGPQASRQFFHALMICECLASIEIAARAVSSLG